MHQVNVIKHSTDMCIFTVKTLVKYYTDQMTMFAHVCLEQVKFLVGLIIGHCLQS